MKIYKNGQQMCDANSPENFAKQARAVIVAPAGYGKTELIAKSVSCCEGRQLVLTHTHAGVDSLRKRLKKYNNSSSRYNVDTIHSFALRFAGSYPLTTGLTIQEPQTDEDYSEIISSAIRLFDTKVGKDILKCSYSGIFVDEYQDCQVRQHDLICKLADILPCRITGDPLQGIYDFGENQIVDWERDVFSFFYKLPDLEIPYRWKDTNPQLGEWLKDIRQRLWTNQGIKFDSSIIRIRNGVNQPAKCLYDNLSFTGCLYVICEPKNINYPHYIAKSMKNTYQTIEPITSKELCEYAEEIETSQGKTRLINTIKFAEMCLTSISSECNEVFKSLTKKRINSRKDSKIRLETLFQSIMSNNNLKDVYDLFVFLEETYKPTYKRNQLWQEMKKGLQEIIVGAENSLKEAVWKIRNRLKFQENRVPKHCISRTVLLKGLECDLAIVIKPELFNKKNLYVALTRPSTKLTIISDFNTWSNY